VSSEFESKVQGIPCIIRVDYACVVKGSYSYNAASDYDYHGYTDFEYTICDRRGRPAPWLERKATQADHDRIYEEYFQ
jgi:hypothetical protein